MNYQKVLVTESKRGRGKGIAQNIKFESGISFVTGAYSSIHWKAKEIMISRLARIWNMTAHLSDEHLAILEAHLTTTASDTACACGNTGRIVRNGIEQCDECGRPSPCA